MKGCVPQLCVICVPCKRPASALQAPCVILLNLKGANAATSNLPWPSWTLAADRSRQPHSAEAARWNNFAKSSIWLVFLVSFRKFTSCTNVASPLVECLVQGALRVQRASAGHASRSNDWPAKESQINPCQYIQDVSNRVPDDNSFEMHWNALT